MSFFTLGSASLRFVEGKLVWRTYTAADDQAGETLQCKGTCDGGPRGLWWSFVVHVVSIWDSVLKAKNEPFTILAEYSDCTDIFLSDSTMALPEYTGINDHPIDLVDNRQPPFDLSSHLLSLWYCSSLGRTIVFNCALIVEVSITWPSITGIHCLWLRLYPPGQTAIPTGGGLFLKVCSV